MTKDELKQRARDAKLQEVIAGMDGLLSDDQCAQLMNLWDRGWQACENLYANAERERREELEVVAAAFCLGHENANELFDMYRKVYLIEIGLKGAQND